MIPTDQYYKETIEVFKYFFCLKSDEDLKKLIDWASEVALKYNVPYLNTTHTILYMLMTNMNRIHLTNREEINTKGRDYAERVLQKLSETKEKYAKYYQTANEQKLKKGWKV